MSNRNLVNSLTGMETLESRVVLAASLGPVSLTNDSGASASDAITFDPSITSQVTTTAATESVLVEIDHDADGIAEGTVSLGSSGGTFVYDPLSTDAALANWQDTLTLKLRTVETTSGGPISSNWLDFTMELDRVAPTMETMSPADGAVVNSAPQVTISFNEALDPASVNEFQLFVVDENGNEAQQTVTLTSAAEVELTLAGNLAAGDYTTHVNTVADLAGNQSAAVSASWHLNAAPSVSSIPDIEVSLQDGQTELDLSAYFSDAETAVMFSVGSITDPNQILATASTSVENLNLTFNIGSQGTASIEIIGTDAHGASVTATINVVRQNQPPAITGFSVTYEGDNVYTITGLVTDENKITCIIEFGDYLAGHTAEVDASGSFSYSFVRETQIPIVISAQAKDELASVSPLVVRELL